MLSVDVVPVLEDNYIFILHESDSQETVVVDPAEAAPVLKHLEKRNWKLTAIWNTHHHPDHTGGNLELKELTSCRIVGPEKGYVAIPGIDEVLKEEESSLFIGKYSVKVFETPGHTLTALSYYVEAASALFCGDSLFSLGCGRLFEGTAKDLWSSLEKIKPLPKETLIYCAHEYTESNARFALSIEGNNKDLISYRDKVLQMRKEGESTIPTNLDIELKANPFLRTEAPSVRESLSMQEAPSSEVFGKLRELKDHFKG